MAVKLNLQQLVSALLATLISSSKKGKKWDISLAEIDEIERKLQIAASVLRGLRNTLQPINRLPPELLAEIFTETKQNLPSFLPLVKGGIRSFENHSWLSLIHVCRHWRGIVASYPSLWGTIDNLRGGVKPQVSLKRSRGAPLDVFLSITGPEFAPISDDLIESLIPHIPRFRQFHINTDGWFSNTPIYGSLNRSAPNLRTLTIVTKGRDVVGGVLPSIFNDDMPCLRQLTLEHFTSWPSTYFTHLTHLCLFDQWNDTPVGRPSTAQFLDFLDCSPQLEELAIVRAGPTRDDEDDVPRVDPPNRRISLSHLRELSLGDWPSTTLSRFLSHLTLPRSTQMFIWGHNYNDDDGRDHQDLGSWLPNDLSRLSPVLHLSEIWITRMPDTWARGECPFIAILDDALYLWGFYSTSQIRALAQKLPLETVKKMQLRDCFPYRERMTENMWRGWWFERMKGLESLTVLARDCPVVTRTVLGGLYPKRAEGKGVLVKGREGRKEGSNLKEVGPSRAMSFSKGTRKAVKRADEDDPVVAATPHTEHPEPENETEILCPKLTHIRIEDNPHIPTLFISSLAKTRARRGSPIKRLEVLYFDPILNPPSRRSSRATSPSTTPAATAITTTTTTSSTTVAATAGSDEDTSDGENEGIDNEYRQFTESDYRLLGKYVDEVVVDVCKEKLADVGPPEWPNQAFRWTLPTRAGG